MSGFGNGKNFGIGGKTGGSGGGGGNPTGWDTMLAQNQMQSTDRTAYLGDNRFILNSRGVDTTEFSPGGDVSFFTDDQGIHPSNQVYYFGRQGDGFLSYNQIAWDQAGNFGNLTDGTWQINNNSSMLIGTNAYAGIYAQGGFVEDIPYITSIGDWNANQNYTLITINDNTQTQSFNAANGFLFSGSNYPNGFVSINPDSRQILLGDYNNVNNQIYLSIDDDGRKIRTYGNNDSRSQGIDLDFDNNTFQFGDYNSVNRTEYYKIDAGNGGQYIVTNDYLNISTGNGVNITGGNPIFSDGDLSLMNGMAGIFSDGSLIVYDTLSTIPSQTLVIYGADNGNKFSFIDSSTGFNQLYNDGSKGSYYFVDSSSNNEILGIGIEGIQTLNANGSGYLGDTWLLGDYNAGSQTVSVSVNGTLLNIPTSGGVGLITVTKTAADALVASNGLTNGAFYQITGVNTTLYGGTSIILQATSTNTFSESGNGQFFNPKYDQSIDGYGIWSNRSTWSATLTSGNFIANETVTADNNATATLFTNLDANQFIRLKGDWTAATTFTGNSSGATANVSGVTLVSYPINSTVFWGGKAWINTTGLVGSSTDILNLDGNWNVIPYTDTTQYNTVWDEIKYDYSNDLIIYRKDVANNVVSTSKGNEDYNSDNYGGYPSIAILQWGNSYDYYSGKGVGENTVDGAYCENINFSGNAFIYNNLTENSYFYNNTLSGSSSFNSNTLSGGSDFYNNTLSGSSFNSNTLSSNSSFNSNTLSSNSSFNSNTLSSSSYFQNNTLSNSSYFQNNTIQSNSIWQFTNTITGNTLQNITTNAANVNIDISAATDIYGTFSKNIFSRQDGTPRLSFVNNSDIVVIEDVNY